MVACAHAARMPPYDRHCTPVRQSKMAGIKVCASAKSSARATQSEHLQTARTRTPELSLTCMHKANEAHRAHLRARALHCRSCMHCRRCRCSADEMLTLPSLHSAATTLAHRARVPASLHYSTVPIHVAFWVRLGFLRSPENIALPHYLCGVCTLYTVT